MFNKILLTVDGSDHSQKAAKLAGNLARLSGGSLQMITAYEEVPSYLGEPNRSQAIAERSAEAQKIIDNDLNSLVAARYVKAKARYNL